jgi:hypothetical protein
MGQLSPYKGLFAESLSRQCEMFAIWRREPATHSVGVYSLFLVGKPKLLDSDRNSSMLAKIDIGKASTMRGIADRANVDTAHEQRCRELMRVGGEFDKKIESNAMELVVGSKFIQRLRAIEHICDLVDVCGLSPTEWRRPRPEPPHL